VLFYSKYTYYIAGKDQTDIYSVLIRNLIHSYWTEYSVGKSLTILIKLNKIDVNVCMKEEMLELYYINLIYWISDRTSRIVDQIWYESENHVGAFLIINRIIML